MEVTHVEFYSNICHLVERRTRGYVDTMDVSDVEKNNLMSEIIADILMGLTALWLSGFVVKRQRDKALDELVEHLNLLKLINVREIKENAAK